MAQPAFDWKQCYEQLAPRLLLYARQLTATTTDAEDVVQMAFVRWWRRYPDGTDENVPLLYAAVRTIALDQRRSQTRRVKREAASDCAVLNEDAPVFDVGPEQKETALIIAKALHQLPEDQREVVTLKLWAGLTFAEIAEAVDASPNTVASRYRYALAALQKVLAPMKDEVMPIGDTAMPFFSKPLNAKPLS